MSSNCPGLFTGRGEAKEKQSIEVEEGQGFKDSRIQGVE